MHAVRVWLQTSLLELHVETRLQHSGNTRIRFVYGQTSHVLNIHVQTRPCIRVYVTHLGSSLVSRGTWLGERRNGE